MLRFEVAYEIHQESELHDKKKENLNVSCYDYSVEYVFTTQTQFVFHSPPKYLMNTPVSGEV